MEITKETIEQKIKELQVIKENFIGQLNSVQGAIQALTELLKTGTVQQQLSPLGHCSTDRRYP